MDSSMFIAAMAFVGTLAAVFAISTVMNRRQPAVVRRRLDDHAVALVAFESKRLERIKVLKEQRLSAIPVLDAILRRLKPARTAAKELALANLGLSVPLYLLGRLAASGIALYGVRLVAGSLLYAIPAALAALMLPRLWVVLKGKQRNKAFEDQLAEAIDLLVGALQAGHGFLQGMEGVAKEIGGPITEEFNRVIEQVNLGTDANDALLSVTQRIKSYDYELFVTSVAVQRSTGGNLAEVLQNIAETIRERRRIRAEVKSLTTAPRVSSYVLGGIPIGLLFGLTAINPQYREVMFEERIGHLMIAFSMVWSSLGILFSQAVAKVEY